MCRRRGRGHTQGPRRGRSGQRATTGEGKPLEYSAMRPRVWLNLDDSIHSKLEWTLLPVKLRENFGFEVFKRFKEGFQNQVHVYFILFYSLFLILLYIINITYYMYCVCCIMCVYILIILCVYILYNIVHLICQHVHHLNHVYQLILWGGGQVVNAGKC